ncbi:O-antigen ligase family protein [Aneurinibacillus aneurinilyticus]|jgi:O-antigen ligase|uniref:O-antigen ligase-related domain-containing protein n=2 Tax=Aneurinibacillus aneurinilyticus TaxID=1391 RepID=A0A848CY82_ANEAE|nr:O-antigen ligase family protein [Aneurinibacillus aneurinilyticus]ERI09582.1 O-antigen polymerase [Aneurinibacillus aneurinilyticus ATCC 12856]MCI1695296.1 O-antigen ligase family protein [Aneurinibacillus aneurinilyticus]MED0671078.1 O-antigen ligase family protein [Aneurinibacillus aneurinilyticus]MED0706951.1 O-antigen ligase family protein [Aneurinibacillus aneurinilyticus]MED0725066.1 O-antigen ligase family protein [Aneurinibacillus aneurinilyticus]
MTKTRPMMLLVAVALLAIGIVQYKVGMAGEFVLMGAFLAITLYRTEYGLYLIALSLPILTYRPLLALILLFVLVLFVTAQNYEKLKANLKNHLNLAVFLFLAILLVTALTSVNVIESLKQFMLYYFISFLLYLLLVMKLDTRETLYRFIVCLVLSASLVSLYGVYQYFTLQYTSAAWVDASQNPELKKRIFATFENPNLFVQYLIMILPLNFALIFYSKSLGNRALFMLQFALISLAVVLTFSRSGWVALFLGLLVLATMISRRLLVVGLIAAAVSVNFLPDTIMTRILSIFSPQTDSSSAYRLEMWPSAFAMIRDFWPTGIGSDLTTFKKVYTDYMMPGVRINHFHNIYLMNFVTGGILAILLLLYMFYQSLRTAIVSLFMNDSKDRLLSYVAKAGIGSLIAIASAGMFEDVWHQYRVDFMFWILLAILSVVYNLARARKEQVQG